MSIWFWVALAAPIAVYLAVCTNAAWNWLLRRVPAECEHCGRIVTDSFGTVCAHCRADNDAMRLGNGGGE